MKVEVKLAMYQGSKCQCEVGLCVPYQAVGRGSYCCNKVESTDNRDVA
jgi:hypothetical protein